MTGGPECLFMQSRCVCQNVSEGAWLAVNIINPAEKVRGPG